jgi:hypothetical protein
MGAPWERGYGPIDVHLRVLIARGDLGDVVPQGWRRAFTPGGAPFVVAMGAKELFQIVIGAGQISKMITMKQA